jgi:hypothetical protein
MKRAHIVLLIAVIPLGVLGVLVFAASKQQPITLVTMFVTFTAVIFIFWFFRIRGKKIQTDERTIRITRTAIMYSYYITLYVVAVLMSCDTLGWLRLTGVQALSIVIMVMSVSFLIFDAIMIRRGDSA